ncbi:MAG: efflux RND transporter permease subunit [Clostridia bacterium]|nr:efflux RND transporter permease subunit [Clostridia bacterium]
MINLSIRRPVTTVMITLIVFIAGIVSYNSLDLSFLPSTDLPMVMVSTTYTGCGPEEIEELVTKPIEEQLATLSDVDTITSTSSLGSSRVMVQFNDGVIVDDKMNDIRDKIDQVSRQLPDDAKTPSIMKMDMNQESMYVSITSDKYNSDTLYSFIKNNLKTKFEGISGVASVDIMGGTQYEIDITVDPVKLQNYGITISTISKALSAENTNAPAGSIQQGSTDMDIRAVGKFGSIDDIKNLPITTGNGNAICVKDVAAVAKKPVDQSMIALINGKEGVIMSVDKQSDANIVTVSDNINETVNEIMQEYPSLDIQLMSTTADYIKTSLSNVTKTAIESALIAVLILLIFLRDWKSSLIIGISIPTSIMATFALMYVSGMSMNTISMGAVVIAIGMLVDNSVVVLENINTFHQRGFSPKEAALKGTQEVAMPVMASTLTTVAVFLPLTFVSGMMGTYLKQLGYVICFALIASYVVSITFVPMASALLLSSSDKKIKRKKTIFTYIGGLVLFFLTGLDNFYRKILKASLKHRIITIIIVLAVFLGSLSTLKFMGMDLMSNIDQGVCSVSIELPNGTVFEKSEEMLYQVLDAIGEIPEKKNMFAMVNGSGSCQIIYNLVDKEERTRSTDDICAYIRKKVTNIAGAKITVSASSGAMGSMGGANGFSLEIKDDDTATLRKVGDDCISLISQIPGMYDLENSMDDAVPETDVTIDRAKASKYGVTTTSIASTISAAVSGVKSTTFKENGNELDIKIKYAKDSVKYLDDIKKLTVTTSSGAVIPITNVCNFDVGESAVSINREDQHRYIDISGSYEQSYGYTSTQIQSLIEQKLANYVFPEGCSYSFGGQMKMLKQVSSNLIIVLIVAILLVYMIMASQFESLIYPFIIMFSMPISLTGGLLGLFITGQSVTMTSLMGMIMLVGMVVNNAIVLVDYTNQLRFIHGKDYMEALLEAGPARLRPILMTVLTTVIGLLPMAVATSSGMEMVQPLGITVIFGLSLSTLVTLVFIPVLYSYVTEFEMFVKKKIHNWQDKHYEYYDDDVKDN